MLRAVSLCLCVCVWPAMWIQAITFGDTTTLLARSCLDLPFPM